MTQIVENPRIVLIGSVNSSRKVMESLLRHRMDLVGVLCVEPKYANGISGYNDLVKHVQNEGVKSKYFKNVNDAEVIEFIKVLRPDLLFVIGLSQLINKEVINTATHGCIGFHPTLLPKGRGRAAIAWIVLGKVEPGITFFKIDEGMDSGPIIYQRAFQLPKDPYAGDVIQLIEMEIDKAMDVILPQLKVGVMNESSQNESEATYLGIRRPEDGLINWNLDSQETWKLIRAVSKPLPGAYTFFNDCKLTVWQAFIDTSIKSIGVPGRVIKVEGKMFWIQTKDYPICIQEFESSAKFIPKVGLKLGLDLEKLHLSIYER